MQLLPGPMPSTQGLTVSQIVTYYGLLLPSVYKAGNLLYTESPSPTRPPESNIQASSKTECNVRDMRLPLFELRVADRGLKSDESEIEVLFAEPQMLASANDINGGTAQIQVWHPDPSGSLRFGKGPALKRDNGTEASADLHPGHPMGIVRPSVSNASKLVIVLELLPDNPALIPEWREDQVHCFVRRRATA